MRDDYMKILCGLGFFIPRILRDFIMVGFCFISFFSCPKAQESPENPQEKLLSRAVNFTLNTDFTSKTTVPHGNLTKGMSFFSKGGNYRIDVDGPSTRQSRRLILAASSDQEYTWVEDPKGAIKNNTVIRITYPTVNQWRFLRSIIEPNRLSSGQYTARNIMHNGRQYILLAAQYPSGDESISESPANNFYASITPISDNADANILNKRITKDDFLKDPESYRMGYFSALTFVIDADPNHPFIYQVLGYNYLGEEIYRLDWGEVDLMSPMDDAIFLMPKARIITVGNTVELADAYMGKFGTTEEALMPPKPSLFSRLKKWICGAFVTFGRWCISLLEVILEAHPVVLLLPAAVCLPAIVVLKKKGMTMNGRPKAHRPIAKRR